MRRCLAAALEQQMWFFGCDAACADGNLLVRYGFQRFREETPRGESSRYRCFWHLSGEENSCGEGVPGRAQVDLHGWCAGLHVLAGAAGADQEAEGGFLYVRVRNRLGWYCAPRPPAPGEYDEEASARRAFRLLGRSPEAGFRRAAVKFLRWMAAYEAWIEATCGRRYRQRCFERAPLPWLAPDEGRAWLADYCVGLLHPSD